MRTLRPRTRVWLGVLAVLFASGNTAWSGDNRSAADASSSVQTAPPADADRICAVARAALAAGKLDEAERLLATAVSRCPDHADLQLAWIDAALAQGRLAAALERCRSLPPALSGRPEFCYRAAQAYYRSGILLGKTELCAVPGGQPGQFVGRRLLLERRSGPDMFLCCPPESALYQIRQALDGGLDESTAHLLHARIWQQLGRPRVGLAILRARAAAQPANTDDATLETLAELALDADALPEYLRYTWLLAQHRPQQRDTILPEACLRVAERYARRGDDRLYVQWLRRATRWRPNDPELLLRLADAEWDLAEYDAAGALYARLLELCPAHPQRGRVLDRLTECAEQHAAP